LNFLIPASICVGTLICKATIEDAADPSQHVLSTLRMDFEDLPPVDLHTVLVHYTGVDYFDKPVDAQPTPLDVLETLDYVMRTFPISDVTFDGCEVLPWAAKLAVGENFYNLAGQIGTLRALSGTDDLYIALIPPEAGCGGTCGLGGGGSALFFAKDGPSASHEIGHALGRSLHTPCDMATAPGEDPSYPAYGSYQRGSIGEFGFDTKLLSIQDPSSTYDFMSYCVPRWVSPHTYLGLAAVVKAGGFSSSAMASKASAWSADIAEFCRLGLRIRRGERVPTVEVTNAFQLRRHPPRPTASQASDVMIEVVGDADQVMDVVSCDTPMYDASPEGPFLDYAVTFPWPSGVRSLRVTRAGVVLSTLEVAEEPPTIEITEARLVTTRRGTMVRVTWHGQAPDGVVPGLEYAVRYSQDGQRWRALASALNTSRLAVDLGLLPGGNQCRLQVIATAGLRTSVAETAPFHIPRKLRIPYLVEPHADARYEVGSPVAFFGIGFSPDFGLCPPAEVKWSSQKDGPLGTGYQLTITSLSVGRHRIQLSISDGLGHEQVAERAIAIVQGPSERFTTKASAKSAIESVKKNAARAPVDHETGE
jgi:hypothetical protein